MVLPAVYPAGLSLQTDEHPVGLGPDEVVPGHRGRHETPLSPQKLLRASKAIDSQNFTPFGTMSPAPGTSMRADTGPCRDARLRTRSAWEPATRRRNLAGRGRPRERTLRTCHRNHYQCRGARPPDAGTGAVAQVPPSSSPSRPPLRRAMKPLTVVGCRIGHPTMPLSGWTGRRGRRGSAWEPLFWTSSIRTAGRDWTWERGRVRVRGRRLVDQDRAATSASAV